MTRSRFIRTGKNSLFSFAHFVPRGALDCFRAPSGGSQLDACPGKHGGRFLEVIPGMTSGLPDPRVTWVVDYLQRELSRPDVGRDLAARVNLSPSRLRALFVAQTGMSPLRYLQHVRLRRARLLIERTFLSVKEVMALVGYNDPSHFARDFRREHGAPPSAFRRDGIVTPLSATPSPSADRPTHRRIRRPRARDPGERCA
jgi:AraC-like DNA-binding protein